jgi:hypothetical protein
MVTTRQQEDVVNRRDDKADLYARMAEEVLANPDVSRGTMMGYPCLRYRGRFFASLDRNSADLIVKLPAERVLALIGEGIGRSFAPGGRIFREWVALPEADEPRWRLLAREAMEFAAGER